MSHVFGKEWHIGPDCAFSGCYGDSLWRSSAIIRLPNSCDLPHAVNEHELDHQPISVLPIAKASRVVDV